MSDCYDCLYLNCRASGRFDGYCGPHRRMLERDRLRLMNPTLTHHEAERQVPQFNHAAEQARLVADTRALRYVFPRLRYREARADVIRFNQTEPQL